MNDFLVKLELDKVDSIDHVIIGSVYKILHKDEHHFVVKVSDISDSWVSGVLVADQNNCTVYNDDGRFLESPLSRGSYITFCKDSVVSVRNWK